MVMLCVVCAWHAIIAVCPINVARHWDNIALITLAVIYTLFHIFFFVWMYFVVSREKRKISNNNQLFHLDLSTTTRNET